MNVSFVMRLHNNVVSLVYFLPPHAHDQIVYSFYSVGKLTIRMIHMHIVLKSGSQARYVLFSGQLPLLPFLPNSDTSIHIDGYLIHSCPPLSHLPFTSPLLLPPLLPPSVFHEPIVTRGYNPTHIVKQARYVILL